MPGGLHVAINGAVSDFIRMMVSGCINWQRRGFRLMITEFDAKAAADLALVGQWVSEKKVRVVMDGSVAFTEEGLYQGYDRMLARRNKGKVTATLVK